MLNLFRLAIAVPCSAVLSLGVSAAASSTDLNQAAFLAPATADTVTVSMTNGDEILTVQRSEVPTIRDLKRLISESHQDEDRFHVDLQMITLADPGEMPLPNDAAVENDRYNLVVLERMTVPVRALKQGIAEDIDWGREIVVIPSILRNIEGQNALIALGKASRAVVQAAGLNTRDLGDLCGFMTRAGAKDGVAYGVTHSHDGLAKRVIHLAAPNLQDYVGSREEATEKLRDSYRNIFLEAIRMTAATKSEAQTQTEPPARTVLRLALVGADSGSGIFASLDDINEHGPYRVNGGDSVPLIEMTVQAIRDALNSTIEDNEVPELAGRSISVEEALLEIRGVELAMGFLDRWDDSSCYGLAFRYGVVSKEYRDDICRVLDIEA